MGGLQLRDISSNEDREEIDKSGWIRLIEGMGKKGKKDESAYYDLRRRRWM